MQVVPSRNLPTVSPSNTFALDSYKFVTGTPYSLIVSPDYYYNTPMWHNMQYFTLNTSGVIYRVLLFGTGALFNSDTIYFWRNGIYYETVADAISETSALSVTGLSFIGFPNQTYAPKFAKTQASSESLYVAPEKFEFDYGPFPDECTIVTGGYTIVCKFYGWNTRVGYWATFRGSFTYDHTYTVSGVPYTAHNTTEVIVNVDLPLGLGIAGGSTTTSVTFKVGNFPYSLSAEKTVTATHASFLLSDTVTPTITNSLGGIYAGYFADLTDLNYTFSGAIVFPQTIRVNLPNAYFTGEGGPSIGNVDEILTLDLDDGCYKSDIKNFYNIPGRLIIEQSMFGPSGTGFKFFRGGNFTTHSWSDAQSDRICVGSREFANVYRDQLPYLKQPNDRNSLSSIGNDVYTAIIAQMKSKATGAAGSGDFTDFSLRLYDVDTVVVGVTVPAFTYFLDSSYETGSKLNTDFHGFHYGLGYGTRTHIVSYSFTQSCRKGLVGNTSLNPWSDGQNFFKNSHFFIASQDTGAFVSSIR